MAFETKSPTSNSGTWNTPDNAHTDDLAYAYCGNGEGGRTQEYEGYGFASEGTINEVRVDVKGYSGDETKHSTNVYVWDGTQWWLVGTITSETECFAHQFDATSYINTPEKLNNIKTRIESVGLAGGAPPSRYVRVCWVPVYADWSTAPPTYNVHLESKEDNEATTNLGKIIFDTVEYTLPDDVSKEAGDYQAEYAAATGYDFSSWETTDGVSVSNSTANPTTATVSGNGTLRAVYSEEVAPPLEETIIAKTFPMKYLEKPPHAKQLTSMVQGATVVETAKNFPLILIKRGSAGELESYWIPISLEVEIDVMVSVPDSFVGTHIAAVLPDGVNTKLRLEIPIPEDFKTLTKAELIIVPGGTGNLRRSVSTNFGKVGAAENYDEHSDSIPIGEVPVTQNKIEVIDVSDALTGVAAEDIVGFEFTREGSHANDTVNAPCYVIGFRLSYQK